MDPGIKVDGDDSFVLGADSYTLPGKLMPGEYVMSMNTICRGGPLQTRPGSVSLFDMPDGKPQGCTFFKPSSGVPHLVFAVSGLVYASPYPFKGYSQIPNVRFNANSKFVAWASCVQSTYFTSTGVLDFLDKPRSLLIIQDGNTRAAYWDGAESGHINPTKYAGEDTKEGYDGTPVGLWMAWSNNRLWVTSGNEVRASDAGNPLKFTESKFLAEGRAFYLPGECTGVVETADRQGIICFTENTATLFQSAIQDRTTWLSTPGFSQTVLPGIGCIAPRSIVLQHGLIWWYTSRGLINQNTAMQANISSRVDIQDNEMFASKYNMNYDLTGVAGGRFENFLFHAVPHGSKLNTRVHVLDQAPFEQNINSWPSYWTGWRPVEFATGIVKSKERVFCCSRDYDGVNRMWELFQANKTDNGVPITSYVQTKTHFFDDRDYKRFKFAEIELQGIVGPTAVMVAAAGIRGAYQKVLSKDISSIKGQVYYGTQYGAGERKFASSGSQTRIIKTEESPAASDANSAFVESDKQGLIDKGFSLLIVWSGIAGVSAYRIIATHEPEAIQGNCEADETDEERLLTQEGVGAVGLFSEDSAFETYRSTANLSKIHPITGQTLTQSFTQVSVINQQDADRKATKCAEWFLMKKVGQL